MQDGVVTLLVAALLCMSVLLVGLFVWSFLLRGSVRVIAMSILGMVLNRGRTIDPDAPLKASTEERLSSILTERADEFNFQVDPRVRPSGGPMLQQAPLPPSERGDAAPTTSDNGWPVAMDDEARGDPRGFRHIRLRTDQDEDNTIPGP